MIDEKSDAKRKRYLVVASMLKNSAEFSDVESLSHLAGMSRHKFAMSVSAAKEHLAEQGIIIVNKHGHGYKVGTFSEFKIEVDKACRRAIGHMASMAKFAQLLKLSGKIDGDFDEILSLIFNNLRQIETLFGISLHEEAGLSKEILDQLRIKPESLNTIPYEIIDGEDEV